MERKTTLKYNKTAYKLENTLDTIACLPLLSFG